MAIASTVAWEVRNGGADTNGGGFNSAAAGTDWTQQTAAQYSVTDGVTAGSTIITSATANFGTDVVGNLMYVQGGTGGVTAGWYQINSRTNSTTIVVDRSAGLTAGTGVTLKIGGALATPGAVGQAVPAAGNNVFVKYNASPFIATTASTNVSGGCVAGVGGVVWCGYDTTRSLFNTDANRPTLQINTALSTATLFSGAVAVHTVNLILDGNNQTTSIGTNHRGLVWRCKGINFTAGAFLNGGSVASGAYFSEATGCSAVVPISTQSAHWCESHGNTVSGFTVTYAENCLSWGNTGATSDGFLSTPTAKNCVAYGNGRDGFRAVTSTIQYLYANCVAESNTGNGFNNQGTASSPMFLNKCASFGNLARSAVAANTVIPDIGAITGSGSFFINAAGGVFVTNNTAGAGALLRALGFPALFPAGLTASFADIGAAQSQAVAGGAINPLNGLIVGRM